MLEAFIIEELKRREQEKKREHQRPTVDLPRLPEEKAPQEQEDLEQDKAPRRGVIILDI